MPTIIRFLSAAALLSGLSGCSLFFPNRGLARYDSIEKDLRPIYKKVDSFLATARELPLDVRVPVRVAIDTILVHKKNRAVDIHINKYLSYIPMRDSTVSLLYQQLRSSLGRMHRKDSLTLKTLDLPIQELIPNYYRNDPARLDSTRFPRKLKLDAPVVTNRSRPFTPSFGLEGSHIALWHSHGWYYEEKLDRWEWQRARLFQTVEDILPMSYTLPFLVPMLENAGANVFLPRERDTQRLEIIVDNNTSDTLRYREFADSTAFWQDAADPGFAVGKLPYPDGVNPFLQGTSRKTRAALQESARIEWHPEIQQAGSYAVYISWARSDSNVTDARYTVHHAGGSTSFDINQKIGGGTWIYLGHFTFDSDSLHSAKVTLSNQAADTSGWVSADAVRFGGGMGVIARNGRTSGRPKYLEAARYYMQYAGMPDTLVYQVSGENDYKDDYQARGEWVNYLRGAPFGPNKKRETRGLGIPIDLSIAFHTDAGIAVDDTTVGTLMIYSSEGADSTRIFPDGISRFANRDFGDILQTEIVGDVRRKYDPKWMRRQIWDAGYSEAFRPNVPAVLLELLSHQNFQDMKFSLDPRFRFDVSRAIYKAIVKFLAFQNNRAFAVQPLSVTHFQANFQDSAAVSLSWKPRSDSLETTANPDGYIVYVKENDGGFDNGAWTADPHFLFRNVKPDVVYSFKVCAVNKGGQSFPSEILSVLRRTQSKGTVLVVNGFDRISGPAAVREDSFTGFLDFQDQGVPYKQDLSYVGSQFEFNPKRPWLDDDAPGHGASYGTHETHILAGNTFDYPLLHGRSIAAAGYSFVSCSDESVMDGEVMLGKYKYVDLILGEEKKTPWPGAISGRESQFTAFPSALQTRLAAYLKGGGNLFVSGTAVATDLMQGKPKDHPDVTFGQDVLGYKWRTDHAVASGAVFVVDSSFASGEKFSLSFNTAFTDSIYPAEAPDGIEPSGPDSRTIFRYGENNISAGVAHKSSWNVIALGFPFETILDRSARDKLMDLILQYFQTLKSN